MAILYEDYIKDKEKYDIYTPPKKKTTTKTKQNNNSYFKKSKGNTGQAIGYSALDALGNFTEGSLNFFEGMSDSARYAGANVLDFFGADKKAKEIRKRARENDVEDIVNQWNHITAGDLSGTKSEKEIGRFKKVEDNSIFGEKSDQVIQGVGNSLTGAAVGSYLGAPITEVGKGANLARNVIGLTSFGSSAAGHATTEAYNEGANDFQAGVYGILSGAVESGSEMLFGGLGKINKSLGFGTGALDDVIVKKLTKNIGNTLFRNIATIGLKSAGEGAEEIASLLGDQLVRRMMNMDSKTLKELAEDGTLADTFVQGTLSSLISQTPSGISSTVQGRDYTTGLTRTQQQYVNEIAQQRMVEAQKRNARLNGMQKSQIEDRALTDYQKGRLADASKLEQVNLPGISTKDMDLQQSAYKYGFNPNSEAIVTAKTMLDNRGIKSRFDADAFKNINGNAYWTNKNGVREVIFNPNASEQAILEEIAIHELTHDLMSSKNSKSLLDKQNIIDYVSTLKGYKESRAKLEDLYSKQTKGMNQQKATDLINEEIVADTLGKNIGSQEYIRRLIDDEPSIAKNIYDWVVNKVANKNGVKNEKAYWNNVKNNFEKAYNMEYQGKGSDTRHSLIGPIGAKTAVKADPKNKEIVDLLKEAKSKKRKNILLDIFNKGYSNEDIRKSTMWFQDDDGNWWIEISDANIKLIDDLKQNHEYTLKDILVDNGDTRNLFAAYPKLENQRVKTTTLDGLADGEEINGQYNVDEDVIELNNKYLKEKSMRRTLLHEMQHIIQTIEGTDNGASGQNMIEYMTSMGELEAKETAERANMTQKELYEKAPRSSKKNPIFPILEMINKHPNLPEAKKLMENKDIAKLYNEIYNNGKKGEYNRAKIHKNALKEVQKEAKKDGSGKMLPLANRRGNRKDGTRREVKELDNSSFSLKEKQLEIIQNSNPAADDYHTWIRSIDDIKTYEEALQEDLDGETQDLSPDFKKADLEKALETGKMTVYSSYPIEQGIFVTPSKMEAQSYAGSGKVYSKEISLDDVAWIDTLQGQYAKVQPSDIRYSLTDNQGRELTKEQQEYFKDSKVRDEDGNLLTIYHGTPSGEFNTFKPGSYFTANKEYADGYQWEGASSISYGKQKTIPKTYEVYLNITNPFTLSNPVAKDIYLNEYIKGGNSAYFDPYTDYTDTINNLDEIDWVEGEDLKEWLQEKHPEFDGLYLDEGGDGGYGMAEYRWRGISFVPFNSNQIKNVDNTNPTSSDDIRYAKQNALPLDKNFKPKGTKTRLGDIKLPGVTKTVQEEVQKQTSNALLPIANELKELNKNLTKVMNPSEIAQLTPQDANTTPILPGINRNKVGDGKSKFFDNINEKTNMLNDEQKTAILSNDDVKYYDKVTNKDSLDKAFERLQEGGAEETRRWFNKDVENADATDVAEGWILLKQYADNGQTADMVEVAKKLRNIGTKAGQTVQAFNILSRLTPEGMVKYAQSELLEAYDQMVKNKSKAWIDANRDKFDLKPNEVAFIMDTMKDVSTMEDGYDKRFKLAQIQKVLTDKLPPAKGAGMKAWMRISMLFNPKTQVRNVAGNALIAPVNAFGDMFASFADKVIGSKTGVRTTGNFNLKDYTSGMKKGLYESYNDFKHGVNTRNIQGNRFEVTEGKSFNDNNAIGKALNRVDNLLSFVLDAGDRGFYEASFVNSINNQMVLNNTTEVTQDMIDIATQEALSRTWQDNNEYTKFVIGMRNELNRLVHVNGYGLGDVLIPFAKTPANLTKAIVDYSPVGLVSAINKGIKLNRSLTNGQYNAKTQHEFVQSLGKATAGTLLYVLGYALASAGITSGASDDDKDVANFLKNTLGKSSYSIQIGGKTFTYDWAQPIAAPLSMMANMVQKEKEGATLWENITTTLDTGLNLLFEQSFLESLSNVLSQPGEIGTKMIDQFLDLPARAVPTLFKQITDLVDGTQRQTYVKDKPIESMVNEVKAKIPGLSQTLAPSVDTLGREIQKYGGKNNPFNVFLNPANVNTENISKSGQEIYRLYKETGETNIMPRVAPYYVNKKGEKIVLDTKQRAEYQKVSGSIIESNVAKLLELTEYKNMSDKDKASVVNDIVNYSYNIAQNQVLGTELSKDYVKAYEYSQIGDISDYYEFRNSIDDTNSKTERESVFNYLYNSDLDDNQIAKLYRSCNYSTDKTINAMLELRIPMKEFVKYDTAEIEGKYNPNTGKTINGSKKNAIIEYVNGLNLSKAQKAILIKGTNTFNFDTYNNDIIRYVNTLNGSVDEKKVLLKSIGFDNYDRDVVRYIKSQGLSQEETEKKLEDLGFTIRDGRVYY